MAIFLFVAYVCQAFSVLTFQLLLILLGKGYTITRGQISHAGSIKIAVFMTVYVFVYAGIFLWETEVSAINFSNFFICNKILSHTKKSQIYRAANLKLSRQLFKWERVGSR